VTALLGMERVRGPHHGGNRANIIRSHVEQYRFRHKVRYFTTDNATNYDVAMYGIAMQLGNDKVAFDPVPARMRCFGHVINHLVNPFLWGQNADVVEQELGVWDDDIDTMQILQLWWNRGPFGRIHKICLCILCSSQ